MDISSTVAIEGTLLPIDVALALARSWTPQRRSATRPLVARLDLSELFALVPVHGDTADFLTPPPRSPLPDFAGELAAMRATPADRVAADLAGVPGLPPVVAERIRADPYTATARLAATLQAYWDIALAGHWPRIAGLLEADVLWRSKRLATGGAAALFDDLHETIAWRSGRLTAADPHDHSGSLAGEGLLLVPTVMSWPRVRKMIAPYQPQLAYPARGIATLWESGPPPAPRALAALIGSTRAALLTALAEPSSTTSLAGRLQVTPGAVSQHLSVLRDAGMVTCSRAGRQVLYRRTRTGDTLAASHSTLLSGARCEDREYFLRSDPPAIVAGDGHEPHDSFA